MSMKMRQNCFLYFEVSFESKYFSKSAYYEYFTRKKLKLMVVALIKHAKWKLFSLQRSSLQTLGVKLRN